MTDPTPKLPAGADALLQSFPAHEPDFEALAASITARLATARGAAGTEDLLRAPELAREPGEPPAPSHARVTPPKSSFAEMARRSLQKKDDAAELAKELLVATAQSRRPSAELVERVRAAGRAATNAGNAPLPSSARWDAEEAPRASGVVARVEPAKPAPGKRGALIGVAAGALALAAGMALLLQRGSAEDPTSAALAAERAARAAEAAAPAPPPPAAALPQRQQEGVLSPEALAAAPEAAPVAAGKVVSKLAAATSPGVAAAKPAVAVSAAPVVVELKEDPAPAAVAEQRAPQTEPLPPEPKLRPAEGASGSVPLTPSAGAVGTALSAVRGDAQACLAGQSAPVTASVTFAADGHVLRVSAPGPSASCIQAALSKARITPFARESFTASTTIRPP